MSTTTTNYGLIKPDTTDPILIGQLNDNADAIDAALKENADAIENKPDAADIPTPSTAAPAMDGTAAAGTSTDYARADHVHPSDTSKQDTLNAAQLAAANSGIDSAKVDQIETNKNNILSNTLNGGGINKFQVTATTTTVNGITFTVNANKTITATGSIADSSQNAIFTMGTYTAVSGDVLSEGLEEANLKAYVYARGGSTALTTEPYKAILEGDIGVQRNYACVITKETVGQVNITFKPMICNSNSYAKSGVYQPYAMSNAELTAAIQALQAQLANQ